METLPNELIHKIIQLVVKMDYDCIKGNIMRLHGGYNGLDYYKCDQYTTKCKHVLTFVLIRLGSVCKLFKSILINECEFIYDNENYYKLVL